jgi:hypothetical protein
LRWRNRTRIFYVTERRREIIKERKREEIYYEEN